MIGSIDQPNQFSCLIPYRNELVPPLRDTCKIFDQTSLRGTKILILKTNGMTSFWNNSFRSKVLVDII